MHIHARITVLLHVSSLWILLIVRRLHTNACFTVLLQVAKACSVDRSLVLVTPATVMQQAMVAAVKKDAALVLLQEAAANAKAEAEANAEETAQAALVAQAEQAEQDTATEPGTEPGVAPGTEPVVETGGAVAMTPAEVAWEAAVAMPVLLAVGVGRALRNGEAVPPQDVDALMMAAVSGRRWMMVDVGGC